MSNSCSRLLARASFISLMMTLLCASAQAETLEGAVGAALVNHPSVLAAFANRDALREEQDEQWSNYMPHLDVNAGGGRVFGNNSTSRGLSVTRGEGYSWLWEGGATLTQMLFDGFETSSRVDAAQARRSSANFNILDTREKVALRTIIAYLDVLRSEESVRRLAAHEKKINDYIGRIGSMVEQGGADESMMVQARDIKAQLDNTVSGAQGQLRAAQSKYWELTGHAPDDNMTRPVPPLDRVPGTVEEAIAYAKDHHPTLKAALETLRSYEQEAEAERAAYYPDFKSEVSYLKRDQEDVIGGESIDAKAMVRMNWSYAVGGAQQARVRKNVYRLEESRAQQEDTTLQITRDIEIAYSDRQMAQEQMDIQKGRVTLNADLMKTQEAQFEAAKVNLLQLLQTDNALFNAELALMNGEYRLLAAHYTILASIGRLQEAFNLEPAVAQK